MKLTIYQRVAWLLALAGCFHSQLFAQGFGGGGFGGNNNNSSSRSSSRSATTYPSSTDIGQARITYDPETRSLIVVADEETAEHIKGVVKQLDHPAPQVLIKVLFLEVTYNKNSNIGVSGSYNRKFGSDDAYSADAKQQFANMASTLAGGAGIYTIAGNGFSAQIAAIAEKGKLEVLSRPTILARNNQQATITVGQQVPLITNVRYDNFGNQINGITYQDVGIILRVTPFITSDGLVEMILAPEISSVSDSSVNISSGTNGVAAPIINIRSADTVVVTPDGQTVIIGGLMSTKKNESVSKIPLLGDVPLLGALFRRTKKDDEKTELMIFLTPTIVRNPHDLVAMASTERKNSQIATNAFTEKEMDRYLDKNTEDKDKASEPPPAKK